MESPSARILVVEDDRNSATLLVDLLTAHGHQVVCEPSGLAAIARAREQAIDLLILDLRLPEQNGFMVAESIRRNPATSRLPIMVISAYTDRQNRLRAYRSGVNVVLSKPVDTAELVLVVANLLGVVAQDR
jgi:CheY-like chemotaxis protein